MTLRSPFLISPRLLPGLKIGNGWIQLEYAKRDGRDGRTRYQWTIDIPSGEFTGDDLQSGCQGGGLLEGFRSLISFLIAGGESQACYERTGRESDNADLFPGPVVQWCAQYSEELAIVSFNIEEAGLIEEGAQ
jgi:hypothetical protein